MLKSQDKEHFEQDPDEIIDSLIKLVELAKLAALDQKLVIKQIGLSLQRSGVLAWDQNFKIVNPLISWRDQRALTVIEAFRPYQDQISDISGLPLNAHYAASKLALLQRTYPDARVGFLDSYLFERFGSKDDFITEHTYAARSQLFDIRRSVWSEQLCQYFSVDIKRLPKVVPTRSDFAEILGIPIKASFGDQQAAVIGNQAHKNLVLNLGTVASLLIPTDSEVRVVKGYLTGVLYAESLDSCRYILEATTNACASVLDYLAEIFAERLTLSQLNELALKAEERTQSEDATIAFLPCLGSATPFWRNDLKPIIVNWDKQNRADLARAALENIANFVVYQILDLSKAGLIKDQEIVVSGGLVELTAILQHISDLTKRVLRVSDYTNASARGAALMAMGAPLLIKANNSHHQITPRENQWALKRYNSWLKLYLDSVGMKIPY